MGRGNKKAETDKDTLPAGWIILIHPDGREIPFHPDHAARLMAMPNNGGWKWKTPPGSEEVNDSNKSSDGSQNGGDKKNIGGDSGQRASK